jgi:hypothetical protein
MFKIIIVIIVFKIKERERAKNTQKIHEYKK